jgi:hypothetical protein
MQTTDTLKSSPRSDEPRLLHSTPEGACQRVHRHYAFLVGPSSTPARCRDWMHGTYGGQDKAVVVTTPSAALLFVACLSIRLPAPDAKFEELSVELFGEGASNK